MCRVYQYLHHTRVPFFNWLPVLKKTSCYVVSGSSHLQFFTAYKAKWMVVKKRKRILHCISMIQFFVYLFFNIATICPRSFTNLHTGSMTVRHQLWRVVRFESIRQHLQPTFVVTRGIFSKCLANRLPVWRVDISCDESYDSTKSATPFRGHLRNIF